MLKKDKNHLAKIRTMPCLICGSESEPHHLRASWNAGMGQKPADIFTVPLCRKHHMELHSHGEEIFCSMYDINLWEELIHIWEELDMDNLLCY